MTVTIKIEDVSKVEFKGDWSVIDDGMGDKDLDPSNNDNRSDPPAGGGD